MSFRRLTRVLRESGLKPSEVTMVTTALKFGSYPGREEDNLRMILKSLGVKRDVIERIILVWRYGY